MFPPPHHDITAGSLSRSVLSQCIHAVAALLYPFTWAHTYIPVVPECLLDTVCCPTPFMVGIQMRHLERVLEQPMEEVFHPEGRAAGWSHQFIRVPRSGLAPGLEALVVPFSHSGRLEIRACSMSPPVGTWGNTSTLLWELPCPCSSRSCCWGHPSLEAEESCAGTSHQTCSKNWPCGECPGPPAQVPPAERG